jgi:hypothetical protein
MTLCLPGQQKINFLGIRILAPVGRGSGLWMILLGRMKLLGPASPDGAIVHPVQ